MSGPECCSNPPILSPTAGNGTVEKVGGLHCYLTASPHSNLAVLMLSDVFGYEAPLLRKLADKVAAAGYYVVVPDLLEGDPFKPDDSLYTLPVWLKDHGPEKGADGSKPVIEALKSKGFSAIAGVGFCWGAKVVVELAKSRLIQTAVLLHPSFVSVDDFKAVDTPIAILGAESDKYSPPELVKEFEEILAAKPGVWSFVKIHPGVEHGWAVRYNTEDAEAVKAAEEAHKDLLDWLAKHLNLVMTREKWRRRNRKRMGMERGVLWEVDHHKPPPQPSTTTDHLHRHQTLFRLTTITTYLQSEKSQSRSHCEAVTLIFFTKNLHSFV